MTAANAPAVSEDALRRFCERIYRGFDAYSSVERGMWREVLRVLDEAAAEGLAAAETAPAPGKDFLRSLRHSNEVFAAFKVHAMQEEMAAKLTDGQGRLKPFGKWLKDIGGIASHQTGAWLRTEYDTAVIRAHNAADWQGFERDKDIFPNLRWMPTTSPEPDGAHAVYWKAKLTLPVDDPFWNAHHPGDRWNCKCSLEQTGEPATDGFREADAARPQRGLDNNPGKDGRLFSDTHPYFPGKCSECGFFRKNAKATDKLAAAFTNRRKDCYNCRYIDGCIPGKRKTARLAETQRKAAAHIKTLKAAIPQYDGTAVSGENFSTGSLTVLRNSLRNIYEHGKEDAKLMRWLSEFNKGKLAEMKYEGWAENRPYKPGHPKYDPENPGKRKHNEADYFTYYSLKIGGDTYWANVKIHNGLGGKEILYTIESKKPADLIRGRHGKDGGIR